MIKTISVSTKALKYTDHVTVLFDRYADGSLYVGLLTDDGEEYADITTNLGLTSGAWAYVKTGTEAEAFLKEQRIAAPTELIEKSGFNTYRLWVFDVWKEKSNESFRN